MPINSALMCDIKQLLPFCYRSNYLLIIVCVLASLQAKSQSEENLLLLINNNELTAHHDSIYYELVKVSFPTNIERAKHYAKLSIHLSSKYQHFFTQAKVLRGMGYLYSVNNQLDSASIYYHKAMRVSKLHNFNGRLTDLYNDLGLLYQRIDVYDSALHYFILSYNLSIVEKSFENQAIAGGNIGLAHTYLENFPEAIFYFKEAIALKIKNGITEGLDLNYLNLARIYNEQGRYSDALKELKKVEINCKKGCDDNTLTGLNYSRGYSNLKNGNKAEAYRLFSKALDLARKSQSKQWLANTLYHLSSFSIEHKSYSEALEYLQESERISIEISHRRLLRDIYLRLSTLYKTMGIMDMELHYQTLYTELRESIFNERVANNLKNIQLSEQRKQSKIVLEQKEIALWKSHAVSILLGIVFVLTIMVVYLIYKSLLASRRQRKGMGVEMIRMLGDREEYQRELFRSRMEFTALLNRVTTFLSAPVSTLLGISIIIKKSLGSIESKAVENMIRLCTNIRIVLDNMQELILYKNHGMRLEEIEASSFSEEINNNFKKVKSFIFLTISIRKSVTRKIKSDRTLLLAAVKHAIGYFDHNNENPVVEITVDQFEPEGITKIMIKHNSVNNISVPLKNQFNHLTVMVTTGKLKGDFVIIQRDDHTIIEIVIPTDFKIPINKMVEEKISWT